MDQKLEAERQHNISLMLLWSAIFVAVFVVEMLVRIFQYGLQFVEGNKPFSWGEIILLFSPSIVAGYFYIKSKQIEKKINGANWFIQQDYLKAGRESIWFALITSFVAIVIGLLSNWIWNATGVEQSLIGFGSGFLTLGIAHALVYGWMADRLTFEKFNWDHIHATVKHILHR